MTTPAIHPTREQFRAISDMPSGEPVLMINLLRYRNPAVYADSDPEHGQPPVEGATAYARYAAETEALVLGVGGSQDWVATPMLTVIGPEDESWDHAFVARYPDPQTFMDMVTHPDYQHAVRHRTAALADSRLICCAQASPGATFLAGQSQ